MISILVIAFQLTFGGLTQNQTDVFVPRPFPFEDVAPMGF